MTVAVIETRKTVKIKNPKHTIVGNMKFFYREEPKRRKIEKTGLKKTTFLGKLTRGKNTIFFTMTVK